MKIREAVSEWGAKEENKTLFLKTKTILHALYLKDHGEETMDTLTRENITEWLQESAMHVSDKARATSVMLHVLAWYNANNGLPSPSFVLNDILMQQKPAPVPERKTVPVKEDKKAPEKTKVTKGKGLVRKERRDTTAVRVCQIGPETGEVVKTWESINKASMELGIKNIKRSIILKTKAGGFYWCYEQDTDGFLETFAHQATKRKRQYSKRNTEVCQIDPETGEILKTFANQRTAAENVGGDQATISYAIKTKGKYKGFLWINKNNLISIKEPPKTEKKSELNLLSTEQLVMELRDRGYVVSLTVGR